MEWFRDSYKIVLEQQDDEGKKWIETYREMSLADFEVLYGTITNKIISIEMRLEYGIPNETIICNSNKSE